MGKKMDRIRRAYLVLKAYLKRTPPKRIALDPAVGYKVRTIQKIIRRNS